MLAVSHGNHQHLTGAGRSTSKMPAHMVLSVDIDSLGRRSVSHLYVNSLFKMLLECLHKTAAGFSQKEGSLWPPGSHMYFMTVISEYSSTGYECHPY